MTASRSVGSTPRTGAGTYRPRPQRSVRPADLDRPEREELRGADAAPLPLRRRLETPLLLVTALVLAFLIKTFLVQAFFIPSGSMLETLQIGDRVLVEKVSYRFRAPQRGEILVFRRPGAERGEGLGAVVRSFLEGLGLAQPDEDIDLIKRLIGLPGETIEIRDGVVTVDGAVLDEPYAEGPAADYGPYTVPEGHLFFLGDNRGNSDDSRFSLGPVPRSEVVGRAFVILWPPGNAALLTRPATRVLQVDDADAPAAPPPIDATSTTWLPWPSDASASTFALPPHVPTARPAPSRRVRAPRSTTRRAGCHEPHRPRRHREPARRRAGLPPR